MWFLAKHPNCLQALWQKASFHSKHIVFNLSYFLVTLRGTGHHTQRREQGSCGTEVETTFFMFLFELKSNLSNFVPLK